MVHVASVFMWGAACGGDIEKKMDVLCESRWRVCGKKSRGEFFDMRGVERWYLSRARGSGCVCVRVVGCVLEGRKTKNIVARGS